MKEPHLHNHNGKLYKLNKNMMQQYVLRMETQLSSHEQNINITMITLTE